MRITVQNLYTCFREDMNRVEFGATLGLNLMAQRARYMVPAMPDGTIEGRAFTQALRDIAAAIDASFDKIEGVAEKPTTTKSGLILPPGTLQETKHD